MALALDFRGARKVPSATLAMRPEALIILGQLVVLALALPAALLLGVFL